MGTWDLLGYIYIRAILIACILMVMPMAVILLKSAINRLAERGVFNPITAVFDNVFRACEVVGSWTHTHIVSPVFEFLGLE